MPWIEKYIPDSWKPRGILWEQAWRQLRGSALTGVIIGIAIFLFWPESISPGVILIITLALITLIFLVWWICHYNFVIDLKQDINYLTRYMLGLQRGNLDKKMELDRSDELGELGKELQNMSENYKQQILSRQMIINENSQLINQAEEAASAEERRRLARELHDAVSQELFAASMSLTAVHELIDSDSEKAKQILKDSSNMIHNSQQELRALIMHLRPVSLDGKTLRQGIEQLLSELDTKHNQINFSWEIAELPQLASGVEDQIFRVIQEVISNMLRHSQAENFSVTGKRKGNRVLLNLEDDGKGFDLAQVKKQKSSSYGLKTMTERMNELGGHIEILTYPGAGTRIELKIPLYNFTA